ncbi:MAG TPA: rhomboid family intramembrane serine protease [Stellaceae bacterium]|nr:rhomboid family intramembrane serine protease [Stellaceae bacterium]
MLILPLYDDNPRVTAPVVTYGLIAACAVVFLWQLSLGPGAQEAIAFAYGMVPATLLGSARLPHELQLVPPWATLITSMFLHGGWLHLLGNMLYLWLFGRGVESAMGAPRYLVFYLVSGVAAALAQAAADPGAEVPLIGASGAIAGTLGAYLVLHPRSNIVVFVWIFIFVRLIAVPAVIVLGLWFLMQLLSALATASGEPGIAFWAHVGGFVLGMLLVPLFRRRGVGMLQPRRSTAFSTRRPQRRGPWG